MGEGGRGVRANLPLALIWEMGKGLGVGNGAKEE